MEREIRRFLKNTEVVGHELIYLKETDSTNNDVKRLAKAGGMDGTVVIAGCQTAGRGRQGRSFQSPQGKGLYLSLLLRPRLPAERLIPVTALAGVAVCRAVQRVCGAQLGLKWPNDPILGGKKICGILTELTAGLDVVLGFGINVAQTSVDFSPAVAEVATSLQMELGRAVSKAELAAALIEELDQMYAALRAGDLAGDLAFYRKVCVNLGRTVRLLSDGVWETADAVDIDEEFGLVVRDARGRMRTVRSGEVSVRGLYGYVE